MGYTVGIHEADDQPMVEEDDNYDSDSNSGEEECSCDQEDPGDFIEKKYTILKEKDIHGLQEEDIKQISTVLSISEEAAVMLLLQYKWNTNNVYEEWFADEEAVRATVGILKEPLVKRVGVEEMACVICFKVYSCGSLRSVGCDHLFCDGCWKGYISSSINDGPVCLTLRCPAPSCGVAVGRDTIDELATNEGKESYHRFLFRSYVEGHCKIKWCPGPGCEYAVEYGFGHRNYDVTCSCSYSFCWKCAQEAHRLVDCQTVKRWLEENSAEPKNLKWILANSKPCPKCKVPIERSEGCLHMICRPPCKFQFCWKCLGAWSDHGENTGGFFSCSRYS